MDTIKELRRLASPIQKPQALAWHDGTLWVGSRATKQIQAIDAATWTVRWETVAPGTPYGMTAIDGELRVLCGETADDNRIIRRCVPGQGFDAHFAIPCPEDTGSQLSYDGERLHVSQWYPKRVLALDEHGAVVRTIQAPHEICGQVFAGGILYLLTTDDENTTDYWLTRVDSSSSTPEFKDLVRIPFAARALAFDGTNFWTNHREQNEIVSFARPE